MLDSLYFTNGYYKKILLDHYEEAMKKDSTLYFEIKDEGVKIRRSRSEVVISYSLDKCHIEFNPDFPGSWSSGMRYRESDRMEMTVKNFSRIDTVVQKEINTYDYVTADHPGDGETFDWPMRLSGTPVGKVTDTITKHPLRLKVFAFAQEGTNEDMMQRYVKVKWKGKYLWTSEFFYWTMHEDMWTTGEDGDSIPPHSELEKQRSLRPLNGEEVNMDFLPGNE